VAQIAHGDPAGNQTIPEKDLSRPAEGGTQNGNAASDGNQSLSDKLDKSGGVIKPTQGVDPQIVQPAPVPDPNSTPVIPPAGTPVVRPGQSPNRRHSAVSRSEDKRWPTRTPRCRSFRPIAIDDALKRRGILVVSRAIDRMVTSIQRPLLGPPDPLAC
jgi:hypothetical protein